MYYILYGFLWLISLLPLKVLYILSDALYGLLFYVLKYRKKVVMNNLLLAFPEKTEKERKKIAKKFYHNFTDNFIEVIKLLSASPAFMARHFVGDYSLCNQVYDRGKRCQLLLAHNFNWELGCLAAALKMKHQFIVVYMPLTNKAIDRLFIKIRSRTGAILLPATHLSKAIVPYRNELYMLVLVADQHPGNPGRAWWVNFFNRPTAFIGAPESGARSGNIPVLVCKMIKEKRGYYKIFFEMLEENPAATKPGELTRRYASYLEQFLRQYPEMWLWSHRRWKSEWKPEYGEVIE